MFFWSFPSKQILIKLSGGTSDHKRMTEITSRISEMKVLIVRSGADS